MTQPYEARRLSLGVAVPLSNYKFRTGTRISTVLNADGPTYAPASGTWYFSITPSGDASINQIFNSGSRDAIVVGPSSHPDNPGAREILYVSSTTYPSTIHVGDTEPEFEYLSGDPIAGIGERIPGSWNPSTDDPFMVVTAGIRDVAYGSSLVEGGVYDPFRMYVRLDQGESMSQAVEGKLLATTQYRFGCFYRAWFYDTNSPSIFISIDDGNERFLFQEIRSRIQGNQTQWDFFMSQTRDDNFSSFTHDTWTGVTTSSPTGPTTFLLPYAISGYYGDQVYAQIDMPFLCHAQRTSAYRDGIFAFDHFPVFGTVQWSWEDHIQSIRLANGELREYDPTGGGGRVRKHTYQCQFENVSSDFFDQINTLLQWQDGGNQLVLVTGENYYGKSLPPVLIGKLKTNVVNKRSWALGLRSFTFTFVET